MEMPNETSGCRAPIAAISWRTILWCSPSRPPPPYSFGQFGQVQPLSRIRSNQTFCASEENLALRPPQKVSLSEVIGLRISGGQLASRQVRGSRRKFSRSDISAFPCGNVESTLAIALRNSICISAAPCSGRGGHGPYSGVSQDAPTIEKQEETDMR